MSAIKDAVKYLFDEGYPIEAAQVAAELAALNAVVEAARALVEYRDRAGALNFQLEKADDFLFRMRNALAKAQP